jgi:glycosyltransferase involved in cell wall biosynthesis
MSKRRVLYVLHNHPTLHPGGAEAYALELYEAMRASDRFEPLLVARIGSTVATKRSGHPGTPFSLVDGDDHQYFLFTETEQFDFFRHSLRDKTVYTKHLADFLRAYDPAIVHFQHTLFLGYDLISLVRSLAPRVPILYTLHEFLAICHHHGQLVRTVNDELCLRASPRRCNECFPAITPQEFFLRERFIRSHLAHVDLFLAPSNFLLERYVDWGIPRERIRFEDYGRLPVERFEGPEPDGSRPRSGSRTRIGFFGQISHFKGADLLLRAMQIVGEDEPAAHLWLHGANLEIQPQAFQDEFRGLLAETTRNVTFHGRFEHADLPRLLADVDWVVVPSRWWENSPLVIQEAFLHGRPVICSDIGGMAEKVRDGVDGLHFRVGDPRSLAETLLRAIRTPELWDELSSGIPAVFGMEEHVANLGGIYEELLERRTAEVKA